MTPNEYQKEALRTEGEFPYPVKPRYIWLKRLQNGLMGLSGESGEAIDILKKYMFQGHDIEKEHLALELGDALWYISLAADALGYSLEDIMQMNIEKLQKRYPDGFEASKSVNRSAEDV